MIAATLMRIAVLCLLSVILLPAQVRLVVRGDDFGYSHASNLAMVQAFEQGVMTSASVLVTGPWFAETAAILRKHPKWSVGVHLTITSEWSVLRWRPVSPISEVPSLVAPDGYLWGYGYKAPKPADWPANNSPWAPHAPNPAEVEREFRAQIERAKSMGVKLSYVDCHMGMACRDDLFPITQKLAKEYCLGISKREPDGLQGASPSYPDQSPSGIRHGLRAMLESLAEGLWLYVGHPALDTPELRAVDVNRGDWWAQRRDSVLQVWTEPATRKLIDDNGIELVSMTDLFDYEACVPR